MNIKTFCLTGTLLLFSIGTYAQKKKETINDSNTPLHLLQPEYKIPYKALSTTEVKTDIDRILRYLEKTTHTRVVSEKTGKVITDYSNLPADAQLERGAFRLASYEWGVTYSAMMAAAEATGDAAYMKYVTDRFKFLAEVAPHFRNLLEKNGTTDPQMKQILTPHALDDAGAVCAAMIKAQLQDKSLNLYPLIDNYLDFILNKEYRLADGTFARIRPQLNTLWLDDMFMGVPPIAWYSRMADKEQSKYLAEAVRQIFQFAERMWVPEKKLFRHGWVEGMGDHPAFFWGRANGWALLTMTEVLDVMPSNHPQREKLMNLFREHVRFLFGNFSNRYLCLLYLPRHQPRLARCNGLRPRSATRLACSFYTDQCRRTGRRHLCGYRNGIRSCILLLPPGQCVCRTRLWSCNLGRS